jgi:outer membrane lipoprotein-sorting protein
VCLTLLCAPTLARSQTPPVEQIISNAITARGGDRIARVKDQRFVGQISFGSDALQRFVVEIARGGKIREEIGDPGAVMVRTSNGKTGWVLDPAHGVKEPKARTADDLKNAAASSDLDGPLIGYREKGNRVELAGIDTVKGSPAYRLKITMKDGQERVDDVDCSTFLEVRWQGVVHGPSGETVYESYFDHYRRVNGVMYAFEITSGVKGEPPNQHIVLSQVQLGDPVDDARFGKP